MTLTSLMKSAFRATGFELSRINHPGKDPFTDMRSFVKSEEPVIFDVGAYVGRLACRFRKAFPESEVYCFEPSPSTFRELQQRIAGDVRVHANNMGVGSRNTKLQFNENAEWSLNSFLALGEDAWTKTVSQIEVQVQTLDSFCSEKLIGAIDILKVDTQGYELEVLKGAKHMLESGAINLVYLEVNFARFYQGQASAGQIYDLLTDCGFRLFSFYQTYRMPGNFAGWTDALFVCCRSSEKVGFLNLAGSLDVTAEAFAGAE